ncbi:MAG TPA: anaerobic ribonucleoside-triphosphate reductase activating protein [Salinivirgaceae bacterium]|nr:anaerobic ribonucleoside-triphosphate reductase activating protein [Salinivirgaceae bacterium]
MRIGGFTKQSLIDWEGRVAAVVFTKGCNFRCGFCHNPELVYPELIKKTEDIPEQTIFDYLSTRKNWLDGVVITGGEPTLQRDLKDFIEKIKKMGFAIKLDTNGSLPTVLRELLQTNLLDYVAMDIKTVFETEAYQNICDIKDQNLLTKVKESVEILKESGINYQLRTTVVPKFHTQEIIRELQEQFSYCNYKLQEYRETKIVSTD